MFSLLEEVAVAALLGAMDAMDLRLEDAGVDAVDEAAAVAEVDSDTVAQVAEVVVDTAAADLDVEEEAVAAGVAVAAEEEMAVAAETNDTIKNQILYNCKDISFK